MKLLIVVRHAKSSWKEPLPDTERPLNGRGRRNAPLMAARVRRRLEKDGRGADLLLTSPALRARATAEIFGAELGISEEQLRTDELLYHGSLQDALGLIVGLDPLTRTVLLFGHNPEFTALVNLLCGAGIENLPTCGACAIAFPGQDWSGAKPAAGRLRWFDYPKKKDKKNGPEAGAAA